MAQAKTLTAAELRRATDYIATRPHAARNRAMLLTTHLAGLRVGEVALLSWSDAVDTSEPARVRTTTAPTNIKALPGSGPVPEPFSTSIG